ncbi:NAD-dependent epimerase/dehydratase family protein [Sinorhizobium medicae]|uniref:D-erythronate dehydrogenase n=1 Tax=Sinorhizobium medicae TaxID=110321 RepID=UPI000FD8FF11|nr:D-erythronate dehydrogenase [Sinorhizobium medicae]MDX0439989.1 NAD-dependent epimerase/dehydratase family protein [Sinorhizobium medicae]MDX0490294.1 NAD-dependent epimerase/dehydratase family protein [Sinorhizobium medicae]MDX0494795.1 NAD-dependent epimerase/dehydratase family protein [Sinorhizobium medicae]MDX0539227.1 NAD-dependent epimerase/dehydratase family protein [Sinorhizobium medicae]MDX0871676.1 NAD-dependent epimerase/dehydratase family protein [Sinorhizobium medicae]
MHVMVIGAAGMIGRKLVERLAEEPVSLGREIARLTLVDVVEPPAPPVFSAISTPLSVDLSDEGSAERLMASRPDVIFHLAAVVSGEAEADFDKGYRVNLDGTRALFEAIRREGQRERYVPRVLFASSIAVFGQPFPEKIDDAFFTTPLTSYGTQKAICELLLADYTRRGFFDGIGIRLPTICIRPGKPNKAASGFFSNILREPLSGQEAVLPVEENVRHWFASPRSAVGFFIHAARMDTSIIGPRRNLTMPGLSALVGEEIEALGRIAGQKAVSLIRREPDPVIREIVSGWATDFDARRARELGFTAESNFDEIIRIHIEDELGGRI